MKRGKGSLKTVVPVIVDPTTGPTTRQLAKLLCRVADDDVYTRSTALQALRQLESWGVCPCPATLTAAKSSPAAASDYLQDLVEVGGIPIVVQFLQDAVVAEDQKCLSRSLSVLAAWLRPIDVKTLVMKKGNDKKLLPPSHGKKTTRFYDDTLVKGQKKRTDDDDTTSAAQLLSEAKLQNLQKKLMIQQSSIARLLLLNSNLGCSSSSSSSKLSALEEDHESPASTSTMIDLWKLLSTDLMKDALLPSNALVLHDPSSSTKPSDGSLINKLSPSTVSASALVDASESRRQVLSLSRSVRNVLQIMGNTANQDKSNSDLQSSPSSTAAIDPILTSFLGPTLTTSLGQASTTMDHIFIVAATAMAGFEIVLDQAVQGVEQYVGHDSLKQIESSVIAAIADPLLENVVDDGVETRSSKTRRAVGSSVRSNMVKKQNSNKNSRKSNNDKSKTKAKNSTTTSLEEAKLVTSVRTLYVMALLIPFVQCDDDADEKNDDGRDRDQPQQGSTSSSSCSVSVAIASDRKLMMLQEAASSAHQIVIMAINQQKQQQQQKTATAELELDKTTTVTQVHASSSPRTCTAVLSSTLSCLTLAVDAVVKDDNQTLSPNTARNITTTVVEIMKPCLSIKDSANNSPSQSPSSPLSTNISVARKGCLLLQTVMPFVAELPSQYHVVSKNLGVVAIIGTILASNLPNDITRLADDIYETYCTKKSRGVVGKSQSKPITKHVVSGLLMNSSSSPTSKNESSLSARDATVGWDDGLLKDDAVSSDGDGDEEENENEDESDFGSATHSAETQEVANGVEKDIARLWSF